jgi:enoyl-[acyl-carrier protein] reductase III
MKHRGKKALVTGGTRGIGRAIALRLAEEGASLVLNYLDNDAAAEEALALVRAKNPDASLAKANLADADAAKALAEEAVRRLGRVDYVVHCAALGTFKRVLDLRVNQWDLSFDINVKSFLILVQRLAKHMPKGGSVVALSSSGASRAVPNYGAIGISKAALEALVRYLAAELAPGGIRVNAVSAGPVDTQSLASFPGHEEMKRELARRTPAGRLGRPEDLAGLVSFLLSPDAEWIVGQTLVADGGLSLV